ncbi:MAG: DUF368 domain-containing protein [Saprospiraceae bacterium]|nr:MAG: DUF368 domain-containing protein [Saprospiraceae bacterium]
MGIAEVIPGVSGGTIAFITGIYERLINAIKGILGPEVIGTLRNNGFKAAWRVADGNFLLFLLLGMLTGLVAGVFGVSHLLAEYPSLLWAFFFGLIIASCIYIGRKVKSWGIAEIIAILAGTALAYYITIANPAQGSESLLVVFVAGMIAISALILPGISGSFMLLLMGMYTFILPTVKTALKTFDTGSLIVVAVFALGCLVGLALFSRILAWTFKNYHDPTLALLTGFMLGSLNKIWPWRNVVEYRTNSHGEQVPFIEHNVLPAQFEGEAYFWGAIVLAIIGFTAVFLLDRFGTKPELKENEI